MGFEKTNKNFFDGASYDLGEISGDMTFCGESCLINPSCYGFERKTDNRCKLKAANAEMTTNQAALWTSCKKTRMGNHGEGGGIFVDNANVTISHVMFEYNHASSRGGAAAVYGTSKLVELIMNNVTMKNNSQLQSKQHWHGGGAIFFGFRVQVIAKECRILSNEAHRSVERQSSEVMILKSH